ncbi:alkaline phosphatase PhoX [Elongatibacter sediminis]|uniref:Alkaline phosphatase PhoX n=1 Tax=Elongatibacter sediminis TaxID=3119006 RepID=A0AAW9R5Y5_9GAMM
MLKFRKEPLVAGMLLALSQTAAAGTEPFFVPLTESATVTVPNSTEEFTAPWIAPAGVTQEILTSLDEVEADANQSVVRVPGLGSGASMFDMIAYDPTGRYLFIPHETGIGAGVSRYDIWNDRMETLFSGDLGGLEGDWSGDWGAFDPATFTPAGTLIMGEEWSGTGRVMEIQNPLAPADRIRVRELDTVANTSHEGLRFSADGKTLYFVDEWNSGAIYKVEFKQANSYKAPGVTYVLVADDYDGDPTLNYNQGNNATAIRTGLATWVPLTNKAGKPLTSINPFRNGPTDNPVTNPDTRGGRGAADEVGATPFGRPEDVEVGRLVNGHEVLYFAATSERTVYSVEEIGEGKAIIRKFASDVETPKNLGFDGTTAEMNSPDNLAQDAHGNIYIIEDAPNGSSTGGDVWFARDVDGDGVAESVDHFLSLRVAGSEATGLIFNPADPYEFVIAVQHPASTNLDGVPGGLGDSVWRFDLEGTAFPTP